MLETDVELGEQGRHVDIGELAELLRRALPFVESGPASIGRRFPFRCDFFLRHTRPQCRFNSTDKLMKVTHTLAGAEDVGVVVDNIPLVISET